MSSLWYLTAWQQDVISPFRCPGITKLKKLNLTGLLIVQKRLLWDDLSYPIRHESYTESQNMINIRMGMLRYDVMNPSNGCGFRRIKWHDVADKTLWILLPRKKSRGLAEVQNLLEAVDGSKIVNLHNWWLNFIACYKSLVLLRIGQYIQKWGRGPIEYACR